MIRDYRSLYLAFAIPLILIILFGYALSLDVDNVETVLVDYDKSELSRDFIRKLDASPYFHVAAQLTQTKDAIDYLDHDTAAVAIVIPPDFMKNIRRIGKLSCKLLLTAAILILPALSAAT